MESLHLLMSRLQERGVQLWVHEGELRYRLPSHLCADSDIPLDLAQRKREIIAFLEAPVVSRTMPLGSLPRPPVVPLSQSQTGLWLLQEFGLSQPAYNFPIVIRLEGELDRQRLDRSVREIVNRHEVLRTRFQPVDGTAAQIIDARGLTSIELIDLSQLEPEERSTEADRLVEVLANHEFDLEREHAFRAHLLRLDRTDHTLVFNLHHIVVDPVSVQILMHELNALYRVPCEAACPLPAARVQFADYALWQRDLLEGKVGRKQLAYWTTQLTGATDTLDLPTDRPRPLTPSFRGGTVEFELAPSLTASLDGLNRRHGTTRFMLLLVAFQVLLSRWSGSRDILVGCPVNGRNHQQADELIGFFLNTLVLRADLLGDPAFSEILGQMKTRVADAYEHRDLPFHRLVAELRPGRHGSRQPIFQVMFAYEGAAPPDLHLPGLKATLQSAEHGTSKFDLTLVFMERGGSLRGLFEYAADLFDRCTIERLVGYFTTLLTAVCENPDMPVSRLQILPQSEIRQLLVEWNNTATQWDSGGYSFQELFERRVQRSPDAVAATCRNGTLTYRELNERANGLAWQLMERGVEPDALVAVMTPRNIDWLTTALAIYKAGGAYLPLDPSQPEERLSRILRKSRPTLVLVARDFSERIQRLQSASDSWLPGLLQIEQLAELARDRTNPPVRVEPGHLAYVISTSGSTGEPKGVMIEHRGLLNHLRSKLEDLQLDAGDTIAQTAPLSFDISVWQCFAPLLAGARVYFVDDEVARDPITLFNDIDRAGVSISEVVPAVLGMFLDMMDDARSAPLSLRSLRVMLVTGEAVKPELCRRWLQSYPQIPLINAYGPAECSDDVTLHLLRTPPAPEMVQTPIGRPIGNMRMYLLGQALELLPIGVIGELFVAGIGVGRGYRNDPAATAEMFIPDPFSPERGGRLYRTGDLARYRSDGCLEFVGRQDTQIKLRGHRIELEEVAAAVEQHPEIGECAIVLRQKSSEEAQIVAYIVTEATADDTLVARLRLALQQVLPQYMIPSSFVQLPALPRNANGKIDRRALPDHMPPCVPAGSACQPPRTELETALASIWATVLKLDRVGIHDNFFELGGHSLLAAQAAALIRQKLRSKVLLRQFFASPTVMELAKQLEIAAPEILGTMPRIDERTRWRASYAQQRLWFLDQFASKPGLYNLAVAWRLRGNLDLFALKSSLRAVVRRHDGLRTTFTTEDEVLIQRVAKQEQFELRYVDLSPEPDPDTLAIDLIKAEAEYHFDLAEGPVLRSQLLKLRADEQILLITVHHAVADGWSLDILTSEISELYRAFSAGRDAGLAGLPVRYVDYASWEHGQLQEGRANEHLGFWSEYLKDAPQGLDLPTDRPRPAVESHQGGWFEIEFGSELCSALQRMTQRCHATPFMALMAAFAVVLQRYSGCDDLCIGYPVANRRRAEVQAVVGCFVNTLILRARPFPELSFEAFLRQVRDSVLEAEPHQELPFERLVQELSPDRDLSRHPLFQVLLAYQGASPGGELELPGIVAAPVSFEHRTAKFDLALSLSDSGKELRGGIEYATDLFDRDTIGRLVEHFRALLAHAAEAPELPLRDLQMLPSAERLQISLISKGPELGFAADRCLHELFEEQVSRTPDAIALECGATRICYVELNRRANWLARRLRHAGVSTEKSVAICMGRSIDLVIAILAVLKAGGAYVPIDSRYPAERVAFMLADSHCVVLLTEPGLVDELPHGGAQVFCVGDERAGADGLADREVESGVGPGNLAYCIYTSGSTGLPKGVAIEHRNAVAFLAWAGHAFGGRQSVRVLFSSSVCFDLSIFELFLPLVSGATAVLVDDASALATMADLSAPTLVNTVPSAMQALVDAEAFPTPTTQVVNLAGEPLRPALLHRLNQASPHARVYNLYGPTEYTTYASFHETCGRERQVVPIGRPIANTQLYILDRWLRPVPIGVAGEIHIGGAGLSRGYWERPELTAERYIPNPYGEPGSRMYRTGDLARYRPSGEIEYIGRRDHQVKVRGFRIELGEIEAALMQCRDVVEAVVTADGDDPGNMRLIAYLVGTATSVRPPASTLQAQLIGFLPDYMLPSEYVFLDRIPLQPNGKTDRRALMDIAVPRTTIDANYMPPATDTQRILASIWSHVLDRDQCGIHDNFFAIGGHSLLAMHLVARIARATQWQLPIRDVFLHPTIASMAAFLDSNARPFAARGSVDHPISTAWRDNLSALQDGTQ